MNNKFIKSSFRPPTMNKKGFKAPTRVSSQENTPVSLSSTPSNSSTQSSEQGNPREPLKNISNTTDELSSQQTSTETSGIGPSIIWDSQGSQPIADAELPEWAKDLPENSDSFINKTQDAQSESNLIDISIFDDVLRKTLCGEQTTDGGLVADIKTGVELTHESPTIWSSQEISQRLSQSQKSVKSSQSEIQETNSQVFENSQNTDAIKSDLAKEKKCETNTLVNVGSRADSPDFDAFDGHESENEECARSDENKLLKDMESSKEEKGKDFEKDFADIAAVKNDKSGDTSKMPTHTSPSLESGPDSPEFDAFDCHESEHEEVVTQRENETMKSSDLINEKERRIENQEVITDTKETNADDTLSSHKNTVPYVSRPNSPTLDSNGSRNEQNTTSCQNKAVEPVQTNEESNGKIYDDHTDDEVVKETPVKANSSQGSKFEALMNHDSDETESEYDAIDEHVFSQVVSRLKEFEQLKESSGEDSSDGSVEDQCAKVHERGDSSQSDKNGKKAVTGTDRVSGDSNYAISYSKKSTVSNVNKTHKLFNDREQKRSLYHKTLMKRYHDSRQKNILKRKRVNETCHKSALHQCSLKKRLLELQRSRNEAVWVECCNSNCKKWRYLKNVNDPAELPNNWTCSMNQDHRFNTCTCPEQGITDIGERLENFVECSYTVGSIVWAKVPGDMWWPAMVDDDPDTEDFYWTDDLDDHFSVMLIPSWYHVVFFETSKEKKVERAWVRIENIRKFKIGEVIPKSNKNLLAKQEQKLKIAVKTAENSLRMDLFERRRRYCFAARYQGKWGSAVDWENVDEDEELES